MVIRKRCFHGSRCGIALRPGQFEAILSPFLTTSLPIYGERKSSLLHQRSTAHLSRIL